MRRLVGCFVRVFLFSDMELISQCSFSIVPCRSRNMPDQFARQREPTRTSRPVKISSGCLRLCACGHGVERAQRFLYHSYALKHYGSDFSASSHFNVDVGYLGQNLATQLQKLTNLGWWPVELFALIAFVVSVSVIAYQFASGNRRRSKRIDLVLSDNTFWVAFGAAGVALINFVLTVIVAHTRINQYEDRYLTFTAILGPVSGLLFFTWCLSC